MKRFVLDASVTLSWFIDRPPAQYAAHMKQLLILGGLAVVPSVWQLEVANGFVSAERRGTLIPSETAELLEDFDVVRRSIEISAESGSIRHTVGIARQFGLTAYDAAYLDLARDLQLPIATLDQALIRAAAQANVQLAR
jgi:predicted nucleic acid-binding protein